MFGMVLVFAGLGALGIWLVAAGRDAFWPALGAGIATVIFFAGFLLLVIAYRRRGGLLEEKPTAREVETYREDYRG